MFKSSGLATPSSRRRVDGVDSHAGADIRVRVSVFVYLLRRSQATNAFTRSPPAAICSVFMTEEFVPASLFVQTMSSPVAATMASL
jgi:hypothetical protein